MYFNDPATKNPEKKAFLKENQQNLSFQRPIENVQIPGFPYDGMIFE